MLAVTRPEAPEPAASGSHGSSCAADSLWCPGGEGGERGRCRVGALAQSPG